MAYRLTSASTYLSGPALINTFPSSFAVWYRPTNFTTSASPIAIGDTDADIFAHLNVFTDASFYAGARGTTGYYEATHGSTLSSGTWHHLGGAFASSASQIAYLDGVASTENTQDVGSVSGIDNVSMGVIIKDSSTFNETHGDIAWGGVWNVALSADEFAMMALGVPPWKIRPENYIGAWPLKEVPVGWDITGGGTDLTVNGSPSFADDPPVAPFLVPPQGYYPVGQPKRVKMRHWRQGMSSGAKLGF